MTAIQMPQLGETIIEGTILKWLKEEGDAVERDEPLFEISTDKVDTEVPSPVAGTVTKILVEEGATVPVGTVVMEVDDGTGATSTGTTPEARGEDAPVETPAVEPTSATAAQTAVEEPAAPAIPSGGALPDRGPRSQFVSPIVRKLAAEHGLDLATIAGTGTGGRITKKDVQRAIEGGGGAAPAAPPAVTPAVIPAPAPASTPAVAAPAPAVATAPTGRDTVEPMSHIRKAIAAHMLASVNETARAWTMVEVNVEHLVRLRTRAKDEFLARHGVKLTYLPFVVRATVDALQAYPAVNSRIDGESIVSPAGVNMGIAVSYDAGLIVPVIKGADVMNSVGIAKAIADLAARARAHQLQPDEVHGATFTITNPGPYGSVASVPIINQPNAGILSLDAIVPRPVVIDDAIAIRHIVNVSMSWDHRLIDGEIATRFLARVKQNLESWDFAEDLGL
jgi:2-oxoglutarate dehydrogenase E2 component (dihydrolipoamide succinyltransferase)